MNVGIFDLLERGDESVADLYEQRLSLAEQYDRLGFFAYHLAEHHATPHGLASSPSVFLSAIAQRTKTLRFGPMVYLLPFYHPLRLLEEICMLDQLSHGRLEVGFGRGVSALERAVYDIAPDEAEARSAEVYQILRAGFTDEVINFTGQFYRVDAVPQSLRSFQKPHPRLWYGTSSMQSVERVAADGASVICPGDTDFARQQAKRYTECYRPVIGDPRPPMLGLVRKVVVADTDEQALDIARRAYPRFVELFNYHHDRLGVQIHASGVRPATWDAYACGGQGVTGSPATVTRLLRQQLDGSAFNYLIIEPFWGAMNVADVERSVALFGEQVLPQLNIASPVAMDV